MDESTHVIHCEAQMGVDADGRVCPTSEAGNRRCSQDLMAAGQAAHVECEICGIGQNCKFRPKIAA